MVRCACCGNKAECKECAKCGTCYCSVGCQRDAYEGHVGVCAEINEADMVAARFTESDMKRALGAQPLNPDDFKTSKTLYDIVEYFNGTPGKTVKLYGVPYDRKASRLSRWLPKTSRIGTGAVKLSPDDDKYTPMILVLGEKKTFDDPVSMYSSGLKEFIGDRQDKKKRAYIKEALTKADARKREDEKRATRESEAEKKRKDKEQRDIEEGMRKSGKHEETKTPGVTTNVTTK